MNADPLAQRALLDLQAIDSRSDQFRHQLTSMPEIAEIAALEASRAQLVDAMRDAQIVVDDLSMAQTKADADVEQVKARLQRDQDRMDQGLISNPKDLERMAHELESLKRRVEVLEDEELEVMEQVENATTALNRLKEQVAASETRLQDLVALRDEKTADLGGYLEASSADRTPVAQTIPDELLALYEKLRVSKGGVGAAELRARQCGGCRLSVDNAELARIATSPAESVVRCEECTRILVRTDESGV